jgi:hypothetical protein
MNDPHGWEVVPMFGFKFFAPAVVAVGAWEFLAQDGTRNLVVTLVAIAALCLYRSFRKFRKEKIAGAWDFIDRNLVELILFAVIAPNAARWVMEWGAKFFGAGG